MNMSKRVGLRWQEYQAEQQSANMQAIQSMAAGSGPVSGQQKS